MRSIFEDKPLGPQDTHGQHDRRPQWLGNHDDTEHKTTLAQTLGSRADTAEHTRHFRPRLSKGIHRGAHNNL